MEEFDKDLPNVREIPFLNNKARLKREDPFGFVYISYERGQVPEELKGSYTSFDEARKALGTYLQNRKG
jgi:hypothetical protein